MPFSDGCLLVGELIIHSDWCANLTFGNCHLSSTEYVLGSTTVNILRPIQYSFKALFLFMCTCVCLCTCVGITCVQYPRRSEQGVRSPRLELQEGINAQVEFWETDSGPLNFWAISPDIRHCFIGKWNWGLKPGLETSYIWFQIRPFSADPTQLRLSYMPEHCVNANSESTTRKVWGQCQESNRLLCALEIPTMQ